MRANGHDIITFTETIAMHDKNLRAHIELLETAIYKSTDSAERERGRATIRRLRAGLGESLKR